MAHVQRRKGKNGTTYRVRYVDPDTGAERSRTFKRKAEADDFATSTSHQILAGTYVDPVAGRQTVAAYLTEWLAGQAHLRPGTRGNYATKFRTMVEPFTFGRTPLNKVRASTVRTWQLELLAAPYAPGTIKVARGIVAGAFNQAIADRRITSNPFTGVKAPEVVKHRVVPLTVEQVHAGEDALLERYRAVIPVIAGSGLRASECFGLTVDRVNFLRRTIRVDRQLKGRRRGGAPIFGPPKTDTSDRTVPVGQTVIDAIAEHLRKYPAGPGDLVFRTARGGPVTRGVFGKQWEHSRDAMGLEPGEGLHQLRHFYASLLIGAGRPVKEVQERLGHASAVETLDTYAHLWHGSDDGTRDAVDNVLTRKETGAHEGRRSGTE